MAENIDNNQNQGSQGPPPPPPRNPQQPGYPPPPQRRRSGGNWWIPILIIGVVLVLFFIFIFSIVGMVGNAFEEEEVTVESNSVLYLDFANVQEYSEPNPFGSFFGQSTKPLSYLNLLTAIERAKDDENIKGIYYRPKMGSMGTAKANEFRAKLEEFKESGKFIYAFMDAGTENMYYNSLPADSIFVPLEGMIEFNGYSITSMFFDKTMDMVGVDFYVQKFEDFKSAGESFSRTGYSDSARYQLKVLLNQRMEYFVNDVAKYRDINKDEVLELMNRGIYTADSMMHYGLIDVYATDLQVRSFLKSRANGEDKTFEQVIAETDTSDSEDSKELKLISAAKYLSSNPEPKQEIHDEDSQIAIIYGSGAISSGRKGDTPPFGNQDLQIKSGDYVRYLKDARNDDKVKAIILRIDSPGGSVIASEEIYEEILKTRAVKPVYASMSDVAASGGYYMSMGCDTIIAHPTTITGSIGVILSIPNLSGMVDKINLGVDTINTTQAAQFMNGLFPFTESDKQQLYTLSKGIYDRFVSKVADARGMTFDETRALAKGRVWTGQDAYERNLVDVLGGLEDAIALAKDRIGVPEGKLVYVQTYPKAEDELKALLKAFGLDADMQFSNQTFEERIAQKFGMTPEKLITNMQFMPDYMKAEIRYAFQLAEISKRENVIAAMPNQIHIR